MTVVRDRVQPFQFRVYCCIFWRLNVIGISFLSWMIGKMFSKCTPYWFNTFLSHAKWIIVLCSRRFPLFIKNLADFLKMYLWNVNHHKKLCIRQSSVSSCLLCNYGLPVRFGCKRLKAWVLLKWAATGTIWNTLDPAIRHQINVYLRFELDCFI